MDEDVATRIDGLYALPLERFVAERGALAKKLRAAGRPEEAAAVAALPKPSVAAWAVNQVVRSQGQAARALWEAGDAVLDVQRRLVAGEASGDDLREAVAGERRALASLADAARGLVTGGGRFLGEQNVQAVTETLHAAAVDPAAREAVAAGRAVRPLQLSGLDATAAGSSPAVRTPSERPGRSAGAQRLADRKAADEAADARRRRGERERAARRAEVRRALVRAEHDRDLARERVAEAARQRDEVTARVEAAMRELGAAEDELGRAEQSLARRHEALEQAEGTVESARGDLEQA